MSHLINWMCLCWQKPQTPANIKDHCSSKFCACVCWSMIWYDGGLKFLFVLYFIFCVSQKKESSVSSIWGWVNYDRIFIFRWTNAFNTLRCMLVQVFQPELLFCSSKWVYIRAFPSAYYTVWSTALKKKAIQNQQLFSPGHALYGICEITPEIHDHRTVMIEALSLILQKLSYRYWCRARDFWFRSHDVMWSDSFAMSYLHLTNVKQTGWFYLKGQRNKIFSSFSLKNVWFIY